MALYYLLILWRMSIYKIQFSAVFALYSQSIYSTAGEQSHSWNFSSTCATVNSGYFCSLCFLDFKHFSYLHNLIISEFLFKLSQFIFRRKSKKGRFIRPLLIYIFKTVSTPCRMPKITALQSINHF